MNKEAVSKTIIGLNWEKRYRYNDISDKEFFLETATSLDSDFEHFLDEHPLDNCTALDIGTGTGEQAIFLAKRGINVTATDISPFAISICKQNAKDHNADVTFLVDNILLTNITGQFDLIIDRGCYALIPLNFKDSYLAAVTSLLKTGGHILIKADKKKGVKEPFLNNPAFETEIKDGAKYKIREGKIINTFFIVAKKV